MTYCTDYTNRLSNPMCLSTYIRKNQVDIFKNRLDIANYFPKRLLNHPVYSQRKGIGIGIGKTEPILHPGHKGIK